MARLLRLISMIVLLVGLTSASAPPAVDPAIHEAQLRAIGRQIDRNAEIRAQYKSCPGDIAFRKKPQNPVAGVRGIGTEACDKDIGACYRKCVAGRNGSACYRLGLAFEHNEATVFQNHAQMLFAQGCALGDEAGCTNRASGIRNGAFDGDPMLKRDGKDLDQCYFKTFQLSCVPGNPWGCSMLGQAYALGEGVERDMSKARTYFQMACKGDPAFEACTFAQRYLDGSL